MNTQLLQVNVKLSNNSNELQVPEGESKLLEASSEMDKDQGEMPPLPPLNPMAAKAVKDNNQTLCQSLIMLLVISVAARLVLGCVLPATLMMVVNLAAGAVS